MTSSEKDDSLSDIFTTNDTARTPPTSYFGDTDTKYCSDEVVPWHGNAYMIIEKNTSRAITLKDGKVVLQSIGVVTDSLFNRWECVEKNGYFGFYNAEARVYLGHDGGENVQAKARKLNSWEFFTPRRHPEGGYQFLSPFYEHTLKMLSSVEGGRRLVRTQHGATLWEFEKV